MADSVSVTVLVENTAFGRGVIAEHGLAFWIETNDRRILFDTGQRPDILQVNASHLDIDLASVDTVVLSHGHYDHTGGLDAILDLTDGAHLVLHPGALARRYSRARGGSVGEIGIPPEHSREALEQRAGAVTWLREATSIGDGLWVTGPIPRTNDFEDTGGAFFLDEACAHPDPIEDDQAIFFSSEQGTVVLLGCAHAGLLNTLSFVQEHTGGEGIAAVMGGTHLVNASPERMAETVAALKEIRPALLAPMHCTGARAQAKLAGEFPEAWEPTHVGSRFRFFRGVSSEPA